MNWKKYKIEYPEKKHIALRTQFLVKGYFQINGKKGRPHYMVTRLCAYFEDDTILFEMPSDFVLMEWTNIS